jgi:uncharacterized protein GlcG (DUF336 family)
MIAGLAACAPDAVTAQAKSADSIMVALRPRPSSPRTELTKADVGKIIGQVVQEASARHKPATIVVVDRMGAVLAVYRMRGAPVNLPVEPNPNGTNAKQLVDGLSGVSSVTILGKTYTIVPTAMEAISKAVTGAFISSAHGNAFTTRTASQIIQDHFNPGTENASSGPLYGTQFSSLPCSDLMTRFDPTHPDTLARGPHRAPLGLAGDPGGFPLYKNGELVGAVGVKAEGPYRVDENIYNNDHSTDEIEALAGTIGYDAPVGLRANMITVGGLTLRYSDATPSDFLTNPRRAVTYSKLPASAGTLISVPGYYDKVTGPRTGSTYGAVESGLVKDVSGFISKKVPPLLLVDKNLNNRYPGAAGMGPGALTRTEAVQLLRAAYAVGIESRAQIRNPAGQQYAAITVSVVDTNGTILGIVTIPDAPNFGIDVSLQKARSAVFMSSAYGDSALRSAKANTSPVPGVLPTPDIARFSEAAETFFGRKIFSGGYAWGPRAIGNIERDTFPDGIDNTVNGPLSLPITTSTVFSDGLQLNLVLNNIIQHIGFVAGVPLGGGTVPDTAAYCTQLPGPPTSAPPHLPVLANGLQIFPGGFPIYRKGQLVGGIGISGDGVDQDDMIAFLGVYNAGQQLHGSIEEAPFNIRASVLNAHGAGPHYVNCPYAPFLGSNSQNVCVGK